MTKWEVCRYWNAPECAGVYVIFADDEPIYVGSSGNLKSRLRSHRVIPGYGTGVDTPWGRVPGARDCHIRIKRAQKYGEWAMIELRLIKRLSPRFNVVGVNQRKAWRVG